MGSYRELPFCSFCDQLLNRVKYIASDNKHVHKHCLGRYEASITFLRDSVKEIPMRFYLKQRQYVLTCDGCPKEKTMNCVRADIRKIAEADSWAQMGNRFLCPECVLSTRRKLYRAVSFTK